MMFQEISKKEFDDLFTTGSPSREMLVRETKWWGSLDRTILVFVGLDITDKDWMGGILGLDEKGDFRAIETISDFDSEVKATNEILNRSQSIFLSGKVIFFQDFEPQTPQLIPEFEKSLNVLVHSQRSDQEEIAQVLAELSLIYKTLGGSGISFEALGIELHEYSEV